MRRWARNPLSCALEEGSWDFVDAPTQPQEAAQHKGAAGLAQLTPSPLEDVAKTNKDSSTVETEPTLATGMYFSWIYPIRGPPLPPGEVYPVLWQ